MFHGRRVSTLLVPVLLQALAFAAPPVAIGVASSESSFAVGTPKARGQATIFEGDAVRSDFLATRVNLKDGSRYVLGIASQGTIHRDHLLLRSGSAEVRNSGRILAAGLNVAPAVSGTAATVYLSGKNMVTVMVRAGEVRVAQAGGKSPASVRAGQVILFRPDARGGLQMDSDRALAEVARVQGDQVAGLTEFAQTNTCIQTRAGALSRSYSDFSVRLAGIEAARGAILNRMERGIATPADYQQLSNLAKNLRGLEGASTALAAELDGVVFQFHHPGDTPTDPSPHTTHGHSHPRHHGQHGHSVDPSTGHHAVPPHQSER